MFLSDQAKAISIAIQSKAQRIRGALRQAFRDSILGVQTETRFLDSFLTQIDAAMQGVHLEGFYFGVNAAKIHQRPIVSFPDGSSGCELGDLLVTVKYWLTSHKYEAKSILYQVKLCEGTSLNCRIDQTQLHLLHSWPPFLFGRKSAGVQRYDIKPKTLEFGSYLLLRRNPTASDFANAYAKYYGMAPSARRVAASGPTVVRLTRLPYTLGDVSAFYNHLAFLAGEHHQNRRVAALVGSLHRYVGLASDPPDEFEEFRGNAEEGAFAAVVIDVKSGTHQRGV